jgi:hypothetical protein
MLLLFSSIILGGVALLWRSSLNTTGLQKDSLGAFYLAQAGIERACAEIAYWGKYYEDIGNNGLFDKWIDGDSPFSSPPHFTDGFSGGNYSVDITRPHGGSKWQDKLTLISVGTKGNSRREIYLRLFMDDSSCSKVGKSGHCGPPWGNAWGLWSRVEADCEWKEQ